MLNLMSSFYRDLFSSVFTDPAPVLEASHTLEGRLQQLQSSAPDGEALVREISGHWKKHLECLEKTGQPRNVYIGGEGHFFMQGVAPSVLGSCFKCNKSCLQGSKWGKKLAASGEKKSS